MLLDQISIHSWIQSNQIKTETGELLNFSKHRFLYDIYADRSDLFCCMKCAQVGVTTYEILKSSHECYNEAYDIIYVLPTADDVKKFSGGKTNKMIAQNPILQSWTRDKDSIEQKQFGSNTIYYQGSWTERAALMITAKKLVVDEYDRCKQQIVEQYDSRLQSVANPKKAFFSNPSLPDFGIDKYYKLSDQKKWHIKHSCGKVYVMDEDCVNYDKEIYECPHCHNEITDEERRMGEWKATSKGEWSGYWIPLWIAPWMPAKKICEAKRTKSAEYFANFVAGLPYIGTGNKVTADTIIRNLTPKINTQKGRIVIGADTGLPNWYVIGNSEGLFYADKCSDFDVFRNYLKRWENCIIVFDGQGELYEQRKLQQEYPGRVFLCFYSVDHKTKQIIRWGTGDEYGKVSVDRNRALQMGIDELTDRKIPIQGTESDWHDFITHWLNIYRVWDEDALGMPTFKWERTGADHLTQAFNYWRVGMDKFGQPKGEIFLNETRTFREAPELQPDKTMKAPPLKQIFRFDEPDDNFEL